MNGEGDFRLRFLHDLVDQHTPIAGDLVAVGESAWAIHGTIPVDGEVLMASYDREQDARVVLDQLARDVP